MFAAVALATPALSLTAAAVAQTEGNSSRIKYDRVNGYSLAFVDADVKRVVDAVMGSMLSANYTIDSDVTGTITLRTAQPVAEESLIPLLEEALAGVDAAIIKRNDGYRIVSRKNARASASVAIAQRSEGDPQTFAPSSPGFASEVVPLQFASADNLAKLIEEFLGDGIASATRDGTNSLLIAGSADERDAAKRLVARFDVDNLAAMQFEIYRLDNVDADTLVAELEEIFQPPYNILGSRVRLAPLPRLKSVLGVASSRADLARIEPWIRRLDSGVSGKRKLYSYAVQNGRAREVASALQSVLGSSVDVAATAPAAGREPRERIDVGGNEARITAPQRDQPAAASAAAPQAGGDGRGPRIVPNDQNNSLLIYADGEEYQFLREALEKLDQPVAQVLIEATLAEVTLNNDLQFGVNFSVLDGVSTQTRITQSNTSGGIPAAIFPGFSVSVIGNTAAAVLNQLESKTNVRVLSAPKLLTLNNETATLQVGDQVPIITQQAQSVVTPGAPIVNTIELRDTGVILQVTPRVNDSGTIILDISQEVSDVAVTTSSGINSPTIQQRRLTTTVATRSGQMIALGGLIRNSTTRSRSGIPGLSQIPIIGALFGQQKTVGNRTELIILLTPTVIRSEQETRAIVDALIDGLDLTQPLVEKARREQVGGKNLESYSPPLPQSLPDPRFPPIPPQQP